MQKTNSRAAGSEKLTRTALALGLVFVTMLGLGFASAPLYKVFCEATGLNGTTNRGTFAPGDIGRKIVMRFDTNVSPALAWSFRPELKSYTVAVGARDMAFFVATNNTDHPITGTATHNVSPSQAGRYFTKIECFCFTQQTLQPHETARMPVIYYIDPKIATDPDTRDLEEITLSYTFYPVKEAGSAKAASTPALSRREAAGTVKAT